MRTSCFVAVKVDPHLKLARGGTGRLEKSEGRSPNLAVTFTARRFTPGLQPFYHSASFGGAVSLHARRGSSERRCGASYHAEVQYVRATIRLQNDCGAAVSAHAALDTVCPNNHDLTVSFSRDEFEAALKSGDLVFHCNTCDTNWPPSKEEIAEIREQFADEE
jgi:hypothetical protein